MHEDTDTIWPWLSEWTPRTPDIIATIEAGRRHEIRGLGRLLGPAWVRERLSEGGTAR